MKDSRLNKIRTKEPIISTFYGIDLLTIPQRVDERYSEHALTHMSLGDTSEYLDRIIKCVVTNQGSLIGAIVGPNGYGKTSTEIYLWYQCEHNGILSVPPIKWRSLSELFAAIRGWLIYKIKKTFPEKVVEIERLSDRYKDKTLQEVASEREIPIATLELMLNKGELVLGYTAEQLLQYLEEATQIVLDCGYKGLLLFTDELQDTLTEYPSREKFLNDLFDLADGLIRHNGKFGLMFVMPTGTEALLNDIRPDIIQRIQGRKVFIRAESTYKRQFPLDLWTKYASLYDFESEKFSIIPKETLDSIGQISERKDLSAGPRTVIDAIINAIYYFDETKQPYDPIELINDYCEKKIAFESGGKLVNAVSEVLETPSISRNSESVRAVKLLSAFPRGCSEEWIEKYKLREEIDSLVSQYYIEYFYKFNEGYSLRKLAEEDIQPEFVFIRLIKDFISRYTEDAAHAEMARNAFKNFIVAERLLDVRQAKNIIGWKGYSLNCFDGTFDPKYPNRKLYLEVNFDQGDSFIKRNIDEIGISFCLLWNQYEAINGDIKKVSGNKALIKLSLLTRPQINVNLPFLSDLGFPDTKITPMFMLSLLDFLEKNSQNIPNNERANEVEVIKNRLVDYSVQTLLNEEILSNSDWKLSRIGLELIKELFHKMCENLYPEYRTFIVVNNWEKNLNIYKSALKDTRLTLRIIRGKDSLEAQKEFIANIFNQSVLSFESLANSWQDLLLLEIWKGRDLGKIRFLYHPLETMILDSLHSSNETTNDSRKKIYHKELFDFCKAKGYLNEEISQAIDILRIRKHITYDDNNGYVEEIKISLEEFKADFQNKIEKLTQKIQELQLIPNFDYDENSKNIASLSRGYSNVETIEDHEEFNHKLKLLEEGIDGFILKYDTIIRTGLQDMAQKINILVNNGVPTSLTNQILGVVPWVADIRDCQGLLVAKFNKVIGGLVRLHGEINSTITSSKAKDAKSILVEHNSYRDFSVRFDVHTAEINATNSYLNGYDNWKALLSISDSVYNDSANARDSYNNSQFFDEFQSLNKQITENFESRRLEALLDSEIFHDKINNLKSKIDSWLRDQRQTFLEKKGNYENVLREKCKVDQYSLRSNFDHFDPTGSFEKLYQEVMEKIVNKNKLFEQDLEKLNIEALYSLKILNNPIQEILASIEEAQISYHEIKQGLNNSIIREISTFEELASKMTFLNEKIVNIEKDLRGMNPKKEIDEKQKLILNLIDEAKSQDFRDLIIAYTKIENEDFSLDKLMKELLGLFQKNQINIRIIKRQ